MREQVLQMIQPKMGDGHLEVAALFAFDRVFDALNFPCETRPNKRDRHGSQERGHPF